MQVPDSSRQITDLDGMGSMSWDEPSQQIADMQPSGLQSSEAQGSDLQGSEQPESVEQPSGKRVSEVRMVWCSLSSWACPMLGQCGLLWGGWKESCPDYARLIVFEQIAI